MIILALDKILLAIAVTEKPPLRKLFWDE